MPDAGPQIASSYHTHVEQIGGVCEIAAAALTAGLDLIDESEETARLRRLASELSRYPGGDQECGLARVLRLVPPAESG